MRVNIEVEVPNSNLAAFFKFLEDPQQQLPFSVAARSTTAQAPAQFAAPATAQQAAPLQAPTQPQTPVTPPQQPKTSATQTAHVAPASASTQAIAPPLNAPASLPNPTVGPNPQGPAAPVLPNGMPFYDPQAEAQRPKTLDDIRDMVMQIAPATRVSIVQDILQRLGVGKLSDIPADKYDYVYQSIHRFFEV